MPPTSEHHSALQATRARLNNLQSREILQTLRDGIGKSADVELRTVRLPATGSVAQLVYIVDMVDARKISRDVLSPLTKLSDSVQKQIQTSTDLRATLGPTLSAVNVQSIIDVDEIHRALLSGAAALFVDGHREALILSVAGPHFRSVDTTKIENVLRGPLEGFVEHLETNLSLIRRRLHDPHLHIETVTVGHRTHTTVAICSIDGVVDPQILGRVRQMVADVDVDGIMDSGELSNLIHPSSIHILPLQLSTERPDRAAIGLLEGRVVLIVDGSPLALVLPAVYPDFFRSVEDYYSPWFLVGLLRLVRNLADHVMGFLPAIYIVLAAYNPGIVQPQFLNVLASSRAQVPYPPVIEAFLGLLLADFIVEATVRSPKVVGGAVPIVGGIVIGSVLSRTHLVSQVMLVVAALTAVTQFTSVVEPTMQVYARFNKYWFVVWTGAFGLLGFMVATAIELAYIASLESVGVPYFSPIAPFHWRWALEMKFAMPARLRPRRLPYLHPSDDSSTSGGTP